MVEGQHAGDLPLDRVESAFAVNHRMDALVVLAQLDADLVDVTAVQTEREPHDAVERRFACPDARGAHPLTEAEHGRLGQRELTQGGDREATGSHTEMMHRATDSPSGAGTTTAPAKLAGRPCLARRARESARGWIG